MRDPTTMTMTGGSDLDIAASSSWDRSARRSWRRASRALLIDEMDKADVRSAERSAERFRRRAFLRFPSCRDVKPPEATSKVRLFSPVRVEEAAGSATIDGGWVECREFPFVVLTSNRERDFPPAFCGAVCASRCRSRARRSARIVKEHLGAAIAAKAEDLIGEFVTSGNRRDRDRSIAQRAHLLLGREGCRNRRSRPPRAPPPGNRTRRVIDPLRPGPARIGASISNR